MTIREKLIHALGGGALAIAIALAANFEGVRHEAYLDPVGIPTICDGHTQGVKLGMRATQAQCDARLQEGMREALAVVDRDVAVEITEPERVAMADFVFNVGAGNFEHSTPLRLVNAGHRDAACNEYQRWVLAGGRRLEGLVKRRDAEAWLCRM